jgi:hypothetical protein
MEGCVRLFFDQLLIEGKKTLLWRSGLALSRGALRQVFLEKFDYAAYGGAPLLGLRKLAIVLHGASDSRAVKNAVRIAETFAKSRMTEKIASELTQLEEISLTEDTELFPGRLDSARLLRNGRGRFDFRRRGKAASTEEASGGDSSKDEADNE